MKQVRARKGQIEGDSMGALTLTLTLAPTLNSLNLTLSPLTLTLSRVFKARPLTTLTLVLTLGEGMLSLPRP